MFCPECGLAMRLMDESKCRDYWSMTKAELEGMIEEWFCSDSRCSVRNGSYTVVRDGIRKCCGHHGPIPAYVIVVLEEV